MKREALKHLMQILCYQVGLCFGQNLLLMEPVFDGGIVEVVGENLLLMVGMGRLHLLLLITVY